MSWFDRYAAAYGSRDPQQIASWFAEDAVYVGAMGTRFEGAAAIAAYARQFSDNLSDDFTLETRTFFEADDRFTAEWTFGGTHDRDGMIGPATGKTFRVEGATIGARRNEKIAFARDYWDSAGLMRQLGLLPQRS